MSAREIVVYARSSYCSYCERTKALLKAKGVAFRVIDIESDPALLQEMMARSGQRAVPQVFIGDKHIGGFDQLRALDAAGGLDPLLQEFK